MGDSPVVDGSRVAFVLGGAGTKGAFEVGVLAHLIVEKGLAPDVIAAASAGAIIGTVLAQARGHDELVAGTDQLREDLLAMTDTDVVFAEQPWLEDFDGTAFGEAIHALLTVENRPERPADPLAPADGSGPAGPAAGPAVPERRHHRWHTLVSVLELLPHAVPARRDATPATTGSLLTLDPLGDALRGRGRAAIAPLDAARVARPGLDLRLAVTALGEGVTHYVTGDGTIVGPDARTPLAGEAAGPVELVEGVLASSTVPMVFEPRALGSDVYVDGGVLENVPVAAAVALGAERIYAVLGVPRSTPRDHRDFTRVNFVGVHLRAANIGFYGTQRDDVAVGLPDGVELTVIEPTVDVVGPFEVSQGLMLLDMDYGWMRAAEVTADLGDDARAAAMRWSDTITAAREWAWFLEEDLWAVGAATPAEWQRLQRLKQFVRDAVASRAALGLATPAGAAGWSDRYEVHRVERPAGLPDSPLDDLAP